LLHVRRIIDAYLLSTNFTTLPASLHNVAFINRVDLSLAAQVTLIRRGRVIPNAEFRSRKG
jgi:hypothetical protein